MRAGNRSPGTLRLRRHYVTLLARAHGGRNPWTVTTDQLVYWLGSNDWAAETRRSASAAVRGFYRWAADSERIAKDPAARLPVIAAPNAIARPAPETVLAATLQAADARTALMVRCAAFAGLRRAEIAALHADSVQNSIDGWALKIRGKGQRERRVPITDRLARELLECANDGWVFPGPHGHLSPDHVGRLVSEALPGRWTTHTLRHRFATIAYRPTRDSLAVRELLGHTKIETTMRYVQLPDDALRVAAAAAGHIAA